MGIQYTYIDFCMLTQNLKTDLTWLSSTCFLYTLQLSVKVDNMYYKYTDLKNNKKTYTILWL